MKTTFDLPDPLIRRAKAAAAEEGRPLRDLVAEAIETRLAARARERAQATSSEWKSFLARLDARGASDDCPFDDVFFASLDEARTAFAASEPRDPFQEAPKPRRRSVGR